MKKIKIMFMFLKLFRMWVTVRYWMLVCKNPIKLSILNVMEDCAIHGFKMIGWWTPEKHQGGAE